MSYIVLARKWRPMRFEEVVGQEHVTRTLMNALRQKRLGHAFIFAGPRGVGKTTTARLLAKVVNCQSRPDGNPCNQCQNCISITNGQNLDVIEIDGASNRGIDEIRNLRENIRFAPATSDFKVYIIDEVHMLSKDAFNALLKTLEEPPSHAIFIFATTEIHKVPLTILSRCQRFDFKRIPTATIVEELTRIAQKENISADREALTLIARKADGSMRDATSILDQLSSFAADKLTVEMVRETLGIIGEDLFFECTGLMDQKDDAAILQFANRLFEKGHDVMNFLQGLEEHFRNLLITRALGSAKSLDTSDFYRQQYEAQAQNFAERDLLHYLDILVQQEQLLKFSENPQLILELLLLKLAHKPLSVDIQELLSLLRNHPGSGGGGVAMSVDRPAGPSPAAPGGDLSGAPVPRAYSGPAGSSPKPEKPQKSDTPRGYQSPLPPPPPVSKAAPPAPPPTPEAPVATPPSRKVTTDLETIHKQWDKIVEAVKKEKIALASFLQDGVPVEIAGPVLKLAFDPKTGFHMDHVQKNAATIENILQNQFNLPLKLQCVKLDFTKEGIQKPLPSPAEVFENMKNKEPVLKKIIELFDCENLD